MATDIIDSKLVKSVLSLSSSLLQLADTGIGQVIVKATLLGGIVGSAGALAHASHIVPILTGAFQNLGGAIAGVTTLSSGGITLGLAGIAALTVGVVELIKYLKDTNDPLYQLNESLTKIEETQAEIDEQGHIANLTKRYKELRSQEQLTVEEESELSSIRKELSDYTYGMVTANDEYNESLDATIEKVGQAAEAEEARHYGVLLNQVLEGADAYREAVEQKAEADAKQAAGLEALTRVQEAWKEENLDATTAIANLKAEISLWQDKVLDGTVTTAEYEAKLNELVNTYYLLTGNTAALTGETEGFIHSFPMLWDAVTSLSEDDVVYTNVFAKMSQDIQDMIDSAPQVDAQIHQYEETVFGLINKGYLKVDQAAQNMGKSVSEVKKMYFEWLSVLWEGTGALDETGEETEVASTNIEELTQRLADINTEIDSVQSALTVLYEAQLEYNEAGSLSVDTIQKLLELDAEYVNALFDENGQLNVNAETISDLIDGKNVLLERLAAEAIATYAAEEAQRQLADQEGNVKGASDSASKGLADAAQAAIDSGKGALTAAVEWAELWKAVKGEGAALNLDEAHIDALLNNVKTYASNIQTLIGSVSTGLSGWQSGSRKRSGSGKTSKSSDKSTKNTTEQLKTSHDDLISRLEQEYSLLEAQNASNEELYQKAQDIRDAYKQAIDELEQSEGYLAKDEKVLKKVAELTEKWYDWQTKVVQEIKEANKSYETTKGLLESEFDLMEHQGQSTDVLVAKIKEIQNNLHQQAEYYRDILARAEELGLTDDDIAEIQTKINKLSSEWWQWQDEINKLAEKANEEYEKLLESYKQTLENQATELNNQKDAILALQGAMQDYYQGQVDDIDNQIQALRDANSELEQQVELEEKLDALAKAKQQKVLAYVNGSWQYIEDTDGVSKAQKELDDLERKRKLEDEIAGLEAEKQVLEELRDSWGNMTDEYEKQQNEWLITQELGINTALDGWQRLVQGAQYWANQYTLIMTGLAQNASLQTALMSGGLSGLTGGSTNLLDNPESSPYYNKPYDAKVDYSAKMLAAQTLDEVLHWASYRDAKIAGEGLSPEHDTQWFVEKWKAEHPGQYALGTLSASGGLSLVGERGAELRVLNRGDGIIPANMTKNLMKWGSVSPSQYAVSSFGGNGQNLSVTIETLSLPNVADGQGFVDYVKNNMFGQMLSFVH